MGLAWALKMWKPKVSHDLMPWFSHTHFKHGRPGLGLQSNGCVRKWTDKPMFGTLVRGKIKTNHGASKVGHCEFGLDQRLLVHFLNVRRWVMFHTHVDAHTPTLENHVCWPIPVLFCLLIDPRCLEWPGIPQWHPELCGRFQDDVAVRNWENLKSKLMGLRSYRSLRIGRRNWRDNLEELTGNTMVSNIIPHEPNESDMPVRNPS